MMASSHRPSTSTRIKPPPPLPPSSSKRPQRRNSQHPTDHATAHADASLTDDTALDHLMSALHLDHSNPHLPPLYPTATPQAVRAHLAAMGYDQVPQDTLAAIVDDLNAGQQQQSKVLGVENGTSSMSQSTSSSRRRRKRAQVTISDESFMSTMPEPASGEQVVDMTTLDDLSLSTTAAAAAADVHASANSTTTLTRNELETYLLDMGYAPSDLDTALVDDLLEALNESVVMGQETMMSMMRGQVEEEQGVSRFTGTVMTDWEADRTDEKQEGWQDQSADGEVRWEMDGHEQSRSEERDSVADTYDEQVQQQQYNHSYQGPSSRRSWSPAPSTSSTLSSRAYMPTGNYASSSSFRSFRAAPPAAPRTSANDPVLRYHKYARAWSNSPFLVRREREAGNAGASVWSLRSSTAAASGASTLMSHSRTDGAGRRVGARPASKWDDTSYASSADGASADKERDVWAVRDWIKAPAGSGGAGAGGRRTPSLNR